MPQFRSFTLSSNGGLLPQLVTACHACPAFDPKTLPVAQHPKFQSFNAIWDTGATGSVITRAVIDSCSLKPTGMTMVHGVHGNQEVETFLINIGLPNGVAFAGITVTRGELTAGNHMLIGMDIITRGDFSITNLGGRTVFTFRVPSMATIDYVVDAKKQVAAAQFKPGPPRGKGRR